MSIKRELNNSCAFEHKTSREQRGYSIGARPNLRRGDALRRSVRAAGNAERGARHASPLRIGTFCRGGFETRPYVRRLA